MVTKLRIWLAVLLAALLTGCCIIDDFCEEDDDTSDSDRPQVAVIFPGQRSITDDPYLTIRGTVQAQSDVQGITIDGRSVTTSDGYATWYTIYTLPSTGHHYPLIVATDNGGDSRWLEIHIQSVQTSELSDATLGTGTSLSNNLANLTISSSGDIYILDVGRNAIIGVDPVRGKRSIVADPDTIDGLVFVQPALIAADADGTLLVVDGYYDYGYRILRIDPVSGTEALISFTHSHPGPAIQMPTGVATGVDGTIYIADYQRRAVFSIDPSNGERHIVSDGTVSPIYNPYAIAVDPDGTLLVSDDGNARLVRIDPDTDNRVYIENSQLLPSIEGIALVDGDAIVVSSRTTTDNDQWRISVCNRLGGVCSTVSDESNGNGPEPVEYIASIGVEPSGTIIGLDSHPERRAAMRIDFESGDRVIMSKGLID
jgi:hypothetical protein